MKVRITRLPDGSYRRRIDYRGASYTSLHGTRADALAELGERCRNLAEILHRAA